MSFGHEKLDVYRAAIEYVGWAYQFCENLAMLTKLGQRGYAFQEQPGEYRASRLGFTGVSLHSYRYAWAERARAVGYPER